MEKHIQIRNVPEELHRTLKSRAALAGMSLSDYLLQEVRKIVEWPTGRGIAPAFAAAASREGCD
jgi:plasmid stability protein